MAEIPNPKETYNQCLSQAFAEVLKQMPSNKARIADALKIVESGGVEVDPDSRALLVKSQSEKGKHYAIGGNDSTGEPVPNDCPCEDATMNAPNGWCKHKLAAVMHRRASDQAKKIIDAAEKAMIAEQDAEAQTEPETEVKPMSEEEAQAYADEMDELNDAADAKEQMDLPGEMDIIEMPDTVTQFEQTNYEPHSFTIKGISHKGFEVLACVRGHDVDDVIEETEKVLKWMVERHFRGNFATTEEVDAEKSRRGHQVSAAQEAHGASDAAGQASAEADQPARESAHRCEYHKMDLVKGTDKQGRVYWSHKVGDRKYCRGKWCEEHDTGFYWNERKDGSGGWWSHKKDDGGYCNPPEEQAA